MVKIQVVGGDVAFSGHHGIRHFLLYVGGNPPRKPLGQSDLGPSFSGPLFSIGNSLIQVRQGKVKEDPKTHFALKQIFNDMNGRINAAQEFVER